VEGDSVIITASPEDLAKILKLNTFKFAGSTLNIEPHQLQPPSSSIKDEENLSQEAKKTQERIMSILSARYDINLKLLNLSRLGQDPGLVQMGMFDAKNRISKLFPVLMVVCDRLFHSAQEKRDAILSVTLAENDLDSISNVTTLAQTFPDLQNLDLSRNKIADLHALGGWRWKFRKLQNLKLTGNPIEHTSPGYTEEIAKWFPTLQILNEIQIRTQAEAAAAASAAPKPIDQSRKSDQASPIPINGPDFRDVNQIGEGFLRQFFNLYDKDRATLANNFYDANSTHSLSINVSAPRSEEGASSHPFPSAAFNNSRNLVKVKALHGQMSKIFRGVQAIKSFWAELPPTQHPDLSTHTAKYLVDCHPLPGLLDPMGQSPRGVDGLVLMVHGEYEEVDVSRAQRIMRSFSRTFVLGPGLPASPAIRVISDILVLRAWSPLVSAPSGQSASMVSAMPAAETRERLLEQLLFRTQMTPEYARLCLEETGWDLEKAVIAFNANKVRLEPAISQKVDTHNNGVMKSKLPVHAFMTPSMAIAP
jgi:nuclear RNA export factor